MSKLKELRLLELAVNELGRRQQEAQKALKTFRAKNPEVVVGQCFAAPLAASSLDELITQARDDAQWLAVKCIGIGSGAACDSGEARIVVLLNELCTRLETR